MKRIISLFLLTAIMLGSTSCATIFTKSSYPLTFMSTPSDAKITIVNRAGNTVFTGITPTMVTLKASAGYMKKEEYTVTFEKQGFVPKTIPVVCKLDGWYIGNIFIGGLIGMLIVDPASGAMYKFEETAINTALEQNNNDVAAEIGLKILDINQVPKDAKLTRIN